MPRLRRLTGLEVIAALGKFGFVVVRVRGSHQRLQRVVGGETQSLTVPVHGRTPLALPTLRNIYRQACLYVPEDELRPHFYAD